MSEEKIIEERNRLIDIINDFDHNNIIERIECLCELFNLFLDDEELECQAIIVQHIKDLTAGFFDKILPIDAHGEPVSPTPIELEPNVNTQSISTRADRNSHSSS